MASATVGAISACFISFHCGAQTMAPACLSKLKHSRHFPKVSAEIWPCHNLHHLNENFVAPMSTSEAFFSTKKLVSH